MHKGDFDEVFFASRQNNEVDALTGNEHANKTLAESPANHGPLVLSDHHETSGGECDIDVDVDDNKDSNIEMVDDPGVWQKVIPPDRAWRPNFPGPDTDENKDGANGETRYAVRGVQGKPSTEVSISNHVINKYSDDEARGDFDYSHSLPRFECNSMTGDCAPK